MAALFAKNAQRGALPKASGPQGMPLASNMMNSLFSQPPQQMMSQQIFPSMMSMQPFQLNTAFSVPAYQQPFMPFQPSMSIPQNSLFQQPSIQAFHQPIIHNQMPQAQQQMFPHQPNLMGINLQQPGFQPLGFQQSQPFGFEQQGFQNQGFQNQGFGQQGSAQSINPFNNFQR